MNEKVAKIEKVIDKGTTGTMQVYGASGSTSIAFQNMSEMMEFSKLLATSGPMIRPAFQGNPGACLAITMQAARWGFDPVAVIQKSYIVKNRAGEEQIAYESQLVHALVNTRAPLIGRLQISYDGEGGDLTCTVSGVLKGADGPSIYTSPAVSQIGVQNSPLWKSDVRQQIHYYSTRAWARRFVPEVILGIMTPDEIEAQESHYGPDHAKDITPSGPRPSRHTLEAPQDPAETYVLVDHIGEPESKAAYPEQWVKELLAASAPTVDGKFTDKAIGYLVNNAEACETMYPLIKDDALVTELQARYAAAEEQRAETPETKVPGGTGAVGDANGSPAAAAPAKEVTESAPPSPPVVAEAAGGPSPQGSPAATPAAVSQPVKAEVPAVVPEPPKPEPAPAVEKTEGPKAIPMPMSAKTKKPDSAAYLIAIQKEMTEAATQPEHIDMILVREGYLSPRKYTPGSNLAVIMSQTSGSIEMFATRRKMTLGQA